MRGPPRAAPAPAFWAPRAPRERLSRLAQCGPPTRARPPPQVREGTREAPRRGGREPEPWRDPTPRFAACPRLEPGAGTPANSETERREDSSCSRRTWQRSGARGCGAPGCSAPAAEPGNRAFPYPSGSSPGCPLPPQPRCALGSGAGTGDVERSLQPSDQLKKQ